MNWHMKRQAQAGFTLIEVLVSLALFALIAGAGLSVLDQVLRAQAQTEARLERLGALQRMMHLVRRDLSESTAGSVRGDSAQMSLGRAADAGGVTISYGMEEGQMARRVAPGDARQVLLSDVAALRWQYLDGSGGWNDGWPVANVAGPPDLRAVAMTLALTTTGEELRRVVAVPQTLRP